MHPIPECGQNLWSLTQGSSPLFREKRTAFPLKPKEIFLKLICWLLSNLGQTQKGDGITCIRLGHCIHKNTTAPAAWAKVLRGRRAQTSTYTLLHLMGSAGHSPVRWGQRGKLILFCHLSSSENMCISHSFLPSPFPFPEAPLPAGPGWCRGSELQTFLRKCHWDGIIRSFENREQIRPHSGR